jgi:adenosylcobinamide-GDP ribazoletransferase
MTTQSRGFFRWQWAAFLTAIRFLTRIPVPEWLFPAGGEQPVLLRASVIYFPLVGALIGTATAGVIAGAEQLWSPWVAVVVGLAFEALLTGALHEDAVADFCDAFGGGRSREDVLRILKDSRVGSFGVLGLTLAVLLRTAAIAEIPFPAQFVAVVASATLGRWVILLVMAWLPPVPERESLTRDVGQRVGLRDVAAGTILAVPGVVALAVAMPVRLVIVLPLLVVFTWLFAISVRRRIGGITGDCLGFACYLGQILALLAVAGHIGWLMKNPP